MLLKEQQRLVAEAEEARRKRVTVTFDLLGRRVRLGAGGGICVQGGAQGCRAQCMSAPGGSVPASTVCCQPVSAQVNVIGRPQPHNGTPFSCRC